MTATPISAREAAGLIVSGEAVLVDIGEADERARAGIFLAFQYPSEIPGVSIANFLRAALQARLADGEELWRTPRKGVCERCWSTPC